MLSKTFYLTETEIFFAGIFEELRKSDNSKHSVFKPNSPINREGVPALHQVHLALLRGEYRNNYWSLIRDYTRSLRYIVDNNYGRTIVCRNAIRFYNILNREAEKKMVELGYCCGTHFISEDNPRSCCGTNHCFVNDNSTYYRYKEVVYCEKCFSASENGSFVKISENCSIEREKFKAYTYVEEQDEQFVTCACCGREYHERCVLHVKKSGVPFCCANCNPTRACPRLKYCAEDLPTTECDEFVMAHLEACGLAMPKKIIIRFVCNMKSTLTVKESIARYREGAQTISHRNCTLLAFFKTHEGNEICFFACYLQLYDSKCEAPANRNSVYLSYIDSINLINVAERTKTYQEILLGLFNYFRHKGFSKIFIWSCPPKRHVDYIFVKKPDSMKIPTPDMLGAWYRKFFELAEERDTITSYTRVHAFALENEWYNLGNVAYFDGDLWPLRLEEAIELVEKEATRRSLTQQEFSDLVWKLLQFQLEGFNDLYFVLFLKELDENDNFIAATSPDLVNCPFVNDRTDLVGFFWQERLEFSDVRQAAFSTLYLVWQLLRENSICLLCRRKTRLNIWLLCKECSTREINTESFSCSISSPGVGVKREPLEKVFVRPNSFEVTRCKTIMHNRNVERNHFTGMSQCYVRLENYANRRNRASPFKEKKIGESGSEGKLLFWADPLFFLLNPTTGHQMRNKLYPSPAT